MRHLTVYHKRFISFILIHCCSFMGETRVRACHGNKRRRLILCCRKSVSSLPRHACSTLAVLTPFLAHSNPLCDCGWGSLTTGKLRFSFFLPEDVVVVTCELPRGEVRYVRDRTSKNNVSCQCARPHANMRAHLCVLALCARASRTRLRMHTRNYLGHTAGASSM